MANMCVSADGYRQAEAARFAALSTAATYKQVFAVAQFALNASDAIQNFKKLNNVSSRGVSIEEEQQAHLRDTYWPGELQMLNEFTQKTVWEDQATLARRYAGRMWAPMAAGFAKEIRKMECEKPRYCGNAFVKRMQEMMVQRSATRANVTLLADRIAFYEIQAINDTDIERRKQVIAMRQGLVQQAATLMASVARGFADAGTTAMGGVNNAISAFGHSWAARNNADNRVGRDPYFHQQTGQMATQSAAQSSMEQDMANYDFAPVGSNNDWTTTAAQDMNTGVSTDTGVVVTPVADAVSNAMMTDLTGSVDFDTSITSGY
jgi:hypothetical protein